MTRGNRKPPIKTKAQLDAELIQGLEMNLENWAKWVIKLLEAGTAMEYYLEYYLDCFRSREARDIQKAWREAKKWPTHDR